MLKDEFKHENLILTINDMNKLKRILYFSVYRKFPNLQKYVDYLNKFAVIFGKLNLPMIWLTPANMVIKMGIPKFKSKQVINNYNKRRSVITIPITSNEKSRVKKNR